MKVEEVEEVESTAAHLAGAATGTHHAPTHHVDHHAPSTGAAEEVEVVEVESTGEHHEVWT